MAKRTLKNLNLLDDFLFGTLVSHKEFGEAFCRKRSMIWKQKTQKTERNASTFPNGHVFTGQLWTDTVLRPAKIMEH